MSFGTTPLSTTTIGTNQFPATAVYVPGSAGGNFTAMQGGPASGADSNGNVSAPVATYVADGSNVAVGSTTDAAWSGSGAGTMIALLKKLVAELAAPLVVNGSTIPLFITAQSGVGSGNSGDLDVSKLHEISIDITTTAVTTNLQFFWERKGADGIYYPLWQSSVLSAASNTISTSIGPGLAYTQSLGQTGRLRWVATGNASFTPNVYGK